MVMWTWIGRSPNGEICCCVDSTEELTFLKNASQRVSS